MDKRQENLYQRIIMILALVSILCLILQAMSTYQYNSTLRTCTGPAEGEGVQMDIHARGNETSSWLKRDTHLLGEIFDAVLTNHSSTEIASWTLRINILENCYLNQFWNGEAEIHQHVGSPEEKYQQLNLASYQSSDILLDYTLDVSDLLIPLSPGDYIIYHPSEAIGETPVRSGEESIVGMILYTDENTDFALTDYQTDFFFRRPLNQGIMFILACVAAAACLLLTGHYLSVRMIYRRTQKDIDLRVEGILCMRKLYTDIYVIDMEKNRIVPAGEREYTDQPEDISLNDHLQLLLDAGEQDQDTMQVFANLATLPIRLTERDYIALDYKTRKDGWRRSCFIPMERRPQMPPHKILLTLQDINNEKQELVSAQEQAESIRTAREEKREFMESISAGIQTPLRSILAHSDTLLAKGDDEEIRHCASEIRETGRMLMSMVDSTLDLARLSAGKIRLSEAPYSLRELIDQTGSAFRISAEEKQIEFLTELSPRIPDMLTGDGPKLREILFHLLGRALSSLESGSIRLRVFTAMKAEGVCHLLISVQGIGTMSDTEKDLMSMDLASGLIGLMGSEMKTASLESGNDTYFEIDQAVSTNDGDAPDPNAEENSPGGDVP